MKNKHIYFHIKIGSHLEQESQAWFDELAATLTDDGCTLLSGVITDQAALHGVLKKIRNLGLTLISVNPQIEQHQGKR